MTTSKPSLSDANNCTLQHGSRFYDAAAVSGRCAAGLPPHAVDEQKPFLVDVRTSLLSAV
jgi:hypothetical protein